MLPFSNEINLRRFVFLDTNWHWIEQSSYKLKQVCISWLCKSSQSFQCYIGLVFCTRELMFALKTWQDIYGFTWNHVLSGCENVFRKIISTVHTVIGRLMKDKYSQLFKTSWDNFIVRTVIECSGKLQSDIQTERALAVNLRLQSWSIELQVGASSPHRSTRHCSMNTWDTYYVGYSQ